MQHSINKASETALKLTQSLDQKLLVDLMSPDINKDLEDVTKDIQEIIKVSAQLSQLANSEVEEIKSN